MNNCCVMVLNISTYIYHKYYTLFGLCVCIVTVCNTNVCSNYFNIDAFSYLLNGTTNKYSTDLLKVQILLQISQTRWKRNK